MKTFSRSLLICTFHALLCFGTATAQTIPNLKARANILCGFDRFDRGQKVIAFTGTGYWMRAVNDHLMTSTEWGGTGGRMHDLTTGESWILGDIDPTPTPDGTFIIQPNPTRFFSTFAMSKTGRFSPMIFTDRKHNGYYQSVGITEKKGDRTTYRVLTGEKQGLIQEYSVRETLHLGYRFTKATKDSVPACANVDRRRLSWEMPVLSPDGQMISTLDSESGHTVLYRLKMPDAHCTKILDLERQTNKVQFDPASKRIVFTDQKSFGIFTYPTVELANISDGKSRTLSIPGEPILYQGFRPDGLVMYTRGRPEESRQNELVILDPSVIPEVGSAAAKAALSIGDLWIRTCFGRMIIFDDNDKLAIGGRINDQTCQQLQQNSALPASVCLVRKAQAQPVTR